MATKRKQARQERRANKPTRFERKEIRKDNRTSRRIQKRDAKTDNRLDKLDQKEDIKALRSELRSDLGQSVISVPSDAVGAVKEIGTGQGVQQAASFIGQGYGMAVAGGSTSANDFMVERESDRDTDIGLDNRRKKPDNSKMMMIIAAIVLVFVFMFKKKG